MIEAKGGTRGLLVPATDRQPTGVTQTRCVAVVGRDGVSQLRCGFKAAASSEGPFKSVATFGGGFCSYRRDVSVASPAVGRVYNLVIYRLCTTQIKAAQPYA